MSSPFDAANEPPGLDDPSATEIADTLRGTFQTAIDLMGGAPALANWGLANSPQFFAAFAKLLPGGAADATPYGYVSDVPVERELTVEEWKADVNDWLRQRGQPPVSYGGATPLDPPLTPEPSEEEWIRQTAELREQPKRTAPAW